MFSERKGFMFRTTLWTKHNDVTNRWDGSLSTSLFLWFDNAYHMRPGLSGVITSRSISNRINVAFGVGICVSISISISILLIFIQTYTIILIVL